MLEKSSKLLIKAFNNQRNLPVNMPPGEKYLFNHVLNTDWPDVLLYEFEDINVTPESIIWKGLKIDLDFLIWPNHNEMYTWKYTISNRLKRKRVKMPPDTYILCTDYWADVYFHWICDALPRVFLMKEYLKDGVLLLPGQYKSSFYLESLRAFEIKKIQTIPVNQYYNVPRLLSPGQPTISGDHYPPLMKQTRKHLIDYFSQSFSGKPSPENIYISRSRTSYRKVLNEEDLLPILKKYDFDVIHFEDYDFAGQVEICSKAKNYISIHGSNVTNLFFMEPGSNIMELRKDKDAFNHSFYLLADSVDLNYYYQGCEFFDRRLGNYFDLVVDPAEFEKNIRKMLGLCVE